MLPPIDGSKLKRILIARTDRFGDVILSTPVFYELKKKYPEIYLAVLAAKKTEAIVTGNPWIDRVIVYDKKGSERGLWNHLRFVSELKRQRFDAVIHLNPANRVHLLSWLAGIPVRIGYDMKYRFALTHSIAETKQYGRRHEADCNFDLLGFIQVPRPDEFRLYVPLKEKDERDLKQIFREYSRPYFVFHPSASCPSKIWPPERFARLADELARKQGVLPVMIGENKGIEHARQMETAMREPAVNLAGRLTIGMLGWLLRGARLLISNDSGPVHVASAVGTPVISIFGRNRVGLNPARWRPISKNSSYIQKDVGCVECLAHRCQIDFLCLKELSVSDVIEEAKKYEAQTIPARSAD